jgi:hypothetical protein
MASSTGGTVKSVSSNGAAVVDFPGPPPYTKTFTDLTDAERTVMLAGLGAGVTVDVTYDDTQTPENVTGVVARRA